MENISSSFKIDKSVVKKKRVKKRSKQLKWYAIQNALLLKHLTTHGYMNTSSDKQINSLAVVSDSQPSLFFSGQKMKSTAFFLLISLLVLIAFLFIVYICVVLPYMQILQLKQENLSLFTNMEKLTNDVHALMFTLEQNKKPGGAVWYTYIIPEASRLLSLLISSYVQHRSAITRAEHANQLQRDNIRYKHQLETGEVPDSDLL